jgi:superfamily I DNA and/or RNA helicase
MNDVLMAVKANRNILFEVLREYGMDYRPISDLERDVFRIIINQAFGKIQFSRADDNRRRTYRNYLSPVEREAMRLERMYMRNSYLRGADLYQEMARVMSIKFRSHFTWREVKGILEFASEVVSDIEMSIAS